jgi:hypothetical protein
LENAAKVPVDTCGHWMARGFDPPFDHGLAPQVLILFIRGL